MVKVFRKFGASCELWEVVANRGRRKIVSGLAYFGKCNNSYSVRYRMK